MILVMKKRTRRTISWIVVVIILAAAAVGVCVKWPVSTWGNILNPAPVIPAGWVNYRNSEYGFSLWYPPDWKVFTGQLQNDVTAVLFGNPIEGTSTYTLRVSIARNDAGFSSAGYVADMLARVKATDEANGPNAPHVSAQFAAMTPFSVDENQGYELSNVFEFDHQGEQIYVAHGNEVLVFDFPVAGANPNISSPTENNAVAHEIVNTLTFIKMRGALPAPVTALDPFNATYVIDGKPVKLVDGKSEVATAPSSTTMITTRIFGQPTSGDLNGDGAADAAFMLQQDSGGSGTFYYVAVAIGTTFGTHGSNAILLGDRIAPQNVEIQNGTIVANYADRRPGEPMTTQPSVGVSKYFTWNGATLQPASSTQGQ